MKRISGFLFDVDGTLVDSNAAHANAWQEALKEAGHEVSFATLRRLIGMGGDHLLPAAIGVEKRSPIGQRIDARHGEIFRTTYLPKLKAFPATRELFTAILRRKCKIAIATSASEDELNPLLEIARVRDLVEAQTSSDDVDQSKPSPDVIEAALKKLGCPPHEVLMIGDTPYDIGAAKRAGVGTIALRTGGWPDSTLNDAIAVYDNPADLLRHIDALTLIAGPKKRMEHTRARRLHMASRWFVQQRG